MPLRLLFGFFTKRFAADSGPPGLRLNFEGSHLRLAPGKETPTTDAWLPLEDCAGLPRQRGTDLIMAANMDWSIPASRTQHLALLQDLV